MSSALAPLARGKSPEAFRTISEVSFDLDVPQHVLRFWETRFSQVRPVKRAGGRRFYRPEDVALLRGIRTLLYADGYTIKGVQKVLRDKGWRHVADIGRSAKGGVPWTEIGDADDALGDALVDAAAQDAIGDEAIGDDTALAATAPDSRVPDAIAHDKIAPLPTPDALELNTGSSVAMAALLRAHVAATEKVAMEEHKRVRLELLLAELLVLRDRLRRVQAAARPKI